jgi:hypothetical protein
MSDKARPWTVVAAGEVLHGPIVPCAARTLHE